MSAISIFITALALAMDAMSLAIFQGIASTENQRKENLIKIALTFGIFQFGMAFIGSVSGTFFIHYISKYSKYISFAIFLFLGLMMLKEAFKGEEMEYDEKSGFFIGRINFSNISYIQNFFIFSGNRNYNSPYCSFRIYFGSKIWRYIWT